MFSNKKYLHIFNIFFPLLFQRFLIYESQIYEYFE